MHLTLLLVEYVESKISPYTLNESGKRTLSVLLKKHDINEIFDAIDQGVKSHLKYDQDGHPTKESAEIFLNKLSGIAAYRKMSLVDQKMHYIKGICKNRHKSSLDDLCLFHLLQEKKSEISFPEPR